MALTCEHRRPLSLANYAAVRVNNIQLLTSALYTFARCPVCHEGAAERERLNSAIGDWCRANRPLSSLSRGLLEQLSLEAPSSSCASSSPQTREQRTRALGVGVDTPVVLEQPLVTLSAPASSSGFASPLLHECPPSTTASPLSPMNPLPVPAILRVPSTCDSDADGITFGVSASFDGARDEEGGERHKQSQQQLLRGESSEASAGSGRTSAQSSSVSLSTSFGAGSRVVGAMASICSPGRFLKSRLRPKPSAAQAEALRWRRIVEDVGWLNMYIIPCRCRKAPEGTSPFAHLGDGYMYVLVYVPGSWPSSCEGRFLASTSSRETPHPARCGVS